VSGRSAGFAHGTGTYPARVRFPPALVLGVLAPPRLGPPVFGSPCLALPCLALGGLTLGGLALGGLPWAPSLAPWADPPPREVAPRPWWAAARSLAEGGPGARPPVTAVVTGRNDPDPPALPAPPVTPGPSPDPGAPKPGPPLPEAGLQVAPEDAEGQLVATGGGGQHGLERGADHGAITLPVSAGYCQPARLCPLGTARPLRVRISATRGATAAAIAREGAILTGTVLVADDDADIVRFVEVNLRLEGFQVVTARDGQEALTKALDLRPDVVLLDVLMPRIDGYTVCERLRADDRGAAIPVILLTANFISHDQEVARKAGANDFVVKPFDPCELMTRVKALARPRP
jgi:CheY-like chemotaxis protein